MTKNYGTAALAILGLTAIMTPAILLASGGNEVGFDAIVRDVESRYHAHAHRIPFMGLISVVAGVSTHGGVRSVHLAEFEDVNGPVDGEELNKLVEQHVGKGWQRIVRETSRDGGEQNLIFVHPEGNRMGMLVVDLDGHDLNLVQVSINPDRLTDEINQHSGKHHPQTDTDETTAKTEPESDKPSATASE